MQTKHLAALIAAATLSGSALAQPYLGLGLGKVRVNLDCTGSNICDKTDTASKIYGGYMLSPNFGVEAAYYDNGKLHQGASDSDVGPVSTVWTGNGFAVFATGVLPLDRLSLFAKLGVASTRVKFSATSGLLGTVTDAERHAAMAFGAGIGYDFTARLGSRLEYERLRLEFMDDKRHANLWTLALQYRF